MIFSCFYRGITFLFSQAVFWIRTGTHLLNPDPDPAKNLNPDPDPAKNLNPDPDPSYFLTLNEIDFLIKRSQLKDLTVMLTIL